MNDDTYLAKRLPMIYVSGPYRATTRNAIAKNVQAAYDLAAKLWDLGASVICPHKNTEDMEGIIDLTHLLNGDFEIVRRCNAVVMLAGWEKSLGAQLERDVAIDEGVKVFYPNESLEVVARFIKDQTLIMNDKLL